MPITTDYRSPRRWRDEARSTQFMGDEGGHLEMGASHVPKLEFIYHKSQILISLIIDDRDTVYSLTIDPLLANEQALVTVAAILILTRFPYFPVEDDARSP